MGEPYHFFSSDPFFAGLAEGLAPGKAWKARFVTVAGRTFRILELDGRLIIRNWLLPLTFVEVEPPEGADILPIRFLPLVRKGEACFGSAAPKHFHSPYADFSRFSSWTDYEADVRFRHRNRLRDLARRRRVLAREAGPLEFCLNETGDEAVDALIGWKAQKLDAAGKKHPFREPTLRPLYDALRRHGMLRFASLRAGGELLAVAAAHHHGRTSLFRATAYNPAYGRGSPGIVLLHFLLRDSYDSGDTECDLLLGDEAYKFEWATNTRLVGPLGNQPRLESLNTDARTRVASRLGRWPRALEVARAGERRLRR